MDKLVQVAIFLAAVISLRLHDSLKDSSNAIFGNALAVNSDAGGHCVAGASEQPLLFPTSVAGNGMKTVDFQVNRTSFGFADANYSQPFDTALANKKVALGCDSINISIVATPEGISLSDSLGLSIQYGNPDGSMAASEIFIFDSGTVSFQQGANSFNCNLGASDLSVTSVLGLKTLRFDLNTCLTGLGITLQAGDTLRFSGKFAINPNGPLTPQFKQVPNFQAACFATQNGVAMSCNSLSETFTLAKSEVVFDFPNTLNGLPIGCNSGQLDWRLFVPNNHFTDYFGNEYRAATKIDSLVFDFDPGLLSAFTGGDVQVSIPGHPVFGSSYFPIRPLSDFPNGHYVAMFDTLQKVPSLNLVQTYTFDLRLNLTPSCASPFGSQLGDNIYGILSKVSYTDRYYAHSIGDGSCVNTKTDQANSTVAYNQPPSFVLSSTTPVNAAAVGGVATWDLLLCNTSAQSNSGLNWLAVEDPTGQVTINSISNITNPGNPIPLALIPYGQNSFAFTPGVNAGQCLKLRLTAATTSCDEVPLLLVSGWNCGAYPSGWTPNDNAPCSSVSLPLSILSSSNTGFQVSNMQAVSTCMGTGEAVNITGSLSSAVSVPSTVYSLSFIWDENGDGVAQPTEAVLAQQQLVGAINANSPLNFNANFAVQPVQACQLILLVETNGASVCSSLTAKLPVPEFHNAGTDLSICTAENLVVAQLGNGPVCDAGNYAFQWSAIAPASLNDLSGTTLANPVLSIDPLAHLGQTIRYVLRTDRLGCGIASYDTVQVWMPNYANGVFDETHLAVQITDCQSFASVCANVPAAALPNFLFTDNGQPITGVTTACASGFNLPVAPGFHQLVATDTVLGCTDTLLVEVNCTSSDTLQVALLLGQTTTVCLYVDELTGPPTSLTNICLDGQFIDYQMVNDSCVQLLGNLVGEESACFVVCDANGFCDTTVVLATVSHPFPNGIFDTLMLGQGGEYCLNPNWLNLAGQVVSFDNICQNQGGVDVVFTPDASSLCVGYQAVGVGTDIACIAICDNLGHCDTLQINVTVVPGATIQDTIFLGLETDSFCLPQGWLPGTLASVTDICPNQNRDNVSFSIQGNCVFYTGFEVGADTACYRFEDVFGNAAIVQLQVFVRKTTPNFFCDSIYIGEKDIYCLDLMELPGQFQDGSIVEICPDIRTNKVKLKYNHLENCLLYEGIEEGRDTACLVYCDMAGYCDTTYLCFSVEPYFDPPSLGPDTATTQKGTPVVVDFLANDTIFGGIEDIFILDPPISGSVVFNLDGSLTYTPDEPFCARWDNFTYVACNPNGCDTAQVSIFINCIELTIFTAVSPNNDDVNDVFYIAKIEDFPDNHLWVYNIWGSLVYETTTYRNNWPGTWGADTDLPDGTYYFILEWKDDGETTVQKGYIEIFR